MTMSNVRRVVSALDVSSAPALTGHETDVAQHAARRHARNAGPLQARRHHASRAGGLVHRQQRRWHAPLRGLHRARTAHFHRHPSEHVLIACCVATSAADWDVRVLMTRPLPTPFGTSSSHDESLAATPLAVDHRRFAHTSTAAGTVSHAVSCFAVRSRSVPPHEQRPLFHHHGSGACRSDAAKRTAGAARCGGVPSRGDGGVHVLSKIAELGQPFRDRERSDRLGREVDSHVAAFFRGNSGSRGRPWCERGSCDAAAGASRPPTSSRWLGPTSRIHPRPTGSMRG